MQSTWKSLDMIQLPFVVLAKGTRTGSDKMELIILNIPNNH